jgi:hypothetical protein
VNLRAEFQHLRPRELVEALSTRIYEPPLSEARDRILAVSSCFRVVVLVLDFDTEVNMQGMLGFLENSTGLFLVETIDAFDCIGARATSDVLRRIDAVLQKHGVTPSQLRADFAGATPYEITSFNETHGDLGTLPDEVEHEAEGLYVHARPGCGEDVWGLLDTFVETNRGDILSEISLIDDT